MTGCCVGFSVCAHDQLQYGTRGACGDQLDPFRRSRSLRRYQPDQVRRVHLSPMSRDAPREQCGW